MDEQHKIAFGALFLVGVLAITLVLAKPVITGTKACNDRKDNDGDGLVDYPSDPGCSSKNDDSELNPYLECDDGKDNDGDGLVDYKDPGCSSPTDNDETNCGDGVCEGGETQQNCPQDCGYPTTTTLPPTTTTLPPTTTTTLPIPLPDLVIQDIWNNGTTISYKIENIGAWEANTSFSELFVDGPSVSIDFVDKQLLPADISIESFSNYIWSCSGESDTIKVCADYNDALEEMDETNNCRTEAWNCNSCSDTDGGLNFGVQGTVSGYLNGNSYSYTDFCADPGAVYEYYCSGTKSLSVIGNCTANCTNGACV